MRSRVHDFKDKLGTVEAKVKLVEDIATEKELCRRNGYYADIAKLEASDGDMSAIDRNSAEGTVITSNQVLSERSQTKMDGQPIRHDSDVGARVYHSGNTRAQVWVVRRLDSDSQNGRWWGVSQVIRQAQSMSHFHHLLKRSSDSVNGQSSRQNFLNVNGHFSESSEHPLNQGSFIFVNIHDFPLIDGYPFAFVALSQKLGVHSPKGSPVLFPLLVSGSQVGRFFENLFANVHAIITASNYSVRQSSKNCERLGAREHENLELSNACTLTRMHADTQFLRGKRVAVIGVGNRMRGDDGVGSVIAERLQELAKGSLLVIDAETVPENYLGVLLDSKPEVALFIDAVDFGGEVGEWALVPLSVLGDKVPTTHTVSLKLLGQILESNGTECLLLAIQPKQIGFGAPMSEEVASAAERIVQMLAQVFGLAVSRPAEMSGEVHGDE
jgi:hydrogenase 3 maturation protease